jgi:hypothetical protein
MTQALDNRIAVIVWAASQDRAKGWARTLNAPIYYISRKPFGSTFKALLPLRYLLQAWDTMRILWRQKPTLVHVTNPPVLAPLVVYVYCRLTGAKYVMDTHSPALYSSRWGWTMPLQRALSRPALVNIVDQERFKELFESWGAVAAIFPRPPELSVLPEPISHTSGKPLEITVVNTFNPDEPLEPIFHAARHLDDVHFFILGDTKLAPPGILKKAPKNVSFTGYLHGDDYWRRIVSSNAVISLTTFPYSLLAGAQDGMFAGIPLIISRQPALTSYFTSGTVFVENTSESIVEGINQFKKHEKKLRCEIAELYLEKRELWSSNYEIFIQNIGAAL